MLVFHWAVEVAVEVMNEPRRFLFPRSYSYCDGPSFQDPMFASIAAIIIHGHSNMLGVHVLSTTSA